MMTSAKEATVNFFSGVGDYIKLIFDVCVVSIKKPPSWKLLMEQMYSIGVLSLPVVATTGASTGIVLAAQTIYQLSSKGLSGVTGILVAKAMITELGPVLTALMVTGRVGSAMCAELGTMKVTEQIDALQSMAINPLRYLVAPRFIAGIFMIPILTMFSTLLGVLGGYLIASYYFAMSYANYFDPMPMNIDMFDVITGFTKSFIFGVLIVTICCYRGMKTKGGAEGVGKSTTQSVVASYISILVTDFFITMAMNNLYKEFIDNFR
jgi:phospholipid/cholesterol/gamma-HCH transport system permease protein